MFTCSLTQAGSTSVLDLQGTADVEQAEEVRTAMLQALTQSGRLEIRFAQGAQIGLPIMQLVCAAHRMARRMGRTVELSGPSCQRIGDAVALAGFCGNPAGDAAAMTDCVWNRRPS